MNRPPMVGEYVHIILQMQCRAALVIRVESEGLPLLRISRPSDEPIVLDRTEPYVSLSSARPTSGWHFMDEHLDD